jgi:hypothetical protein
VNKKAQNEHTISEWRARWDLNPGSSAPQADVLIQPRLRALRTRLLYSNNINADAKGKIINTLLKLKKEKKLALCFLTYYYRKSVINDKRSGFIARAPKIMDYDVLKHLEQ